MAGLLTYAETEASKLIAGGNVTAADLCFSLQVGGGRQAAMPTARSMPEALGAAAGPCRVPFSSPGAGAQC